MLDLLVVVLRHEARTRGRVGVGERPGLKPRVEGDPELGRESVDVEVGDPILSLRTGLDPRVERRDVEQALLSAERRGQPCLDPYARCLVVQEGLATVPPRRLVAAPGRGDRHDGQDHDLDDLAEFPPPALLPRCLRVTLTQGVGGLDVHVLGHLGLSARACRRDGSATPVDL
jgi:hypothetical protein